MKTKLTASALGVMAVVLSSGVTSAHAAPAGTSTNTTASVSAAEQCRTLTYVAKESVKIRTAKRLNATALGLWPKEAKAKNTGCIQNGENYKLCGRPTQPLWLPIDYRGTRGWVPLACTK